MGDGKAHAAAEGAAGGIISLLEVAEADFSKNLVEITSDEEEAVAAHDKATKENEIEKTTKDQDVKYKVQESSDLDKTAGELGADRAGVQSELDAVQEGNQLVEHLLARQHSCAEIKESHGHSFQAQEMLLPQIEQSPSHQCWAL